MTTETVEPTAEQKRIATLQYCLGITKEALSEERRNVARLQQLIKNFADEAVRNCNKTTGNTDASGGVQAEPKTAAT